MLSQAIQHYVDMRRTCGFKFEYQASFLRSFLSLPRPEVISMYASTPLSSGRFGG